MEIDFFRSVVWYVFCWWDFVSSSLNGWDYKNRIMDTMVVVVVVKEQEDIRMLREVLMEEMSFLVNLLLLNMVLVLQIKERTLMNLSLVLGF